MQLLFEDDLVEATLGLCLAGRLAGVGAPEIAEFHAARERCYGVGDPIERGAVFARMHLDWFCRWGLRDRLGAAVDRFPAIAEACEAVVFRRCRGRHDEGAELYVDAEGRRRAVVSLRPDRLVTEPLLTGFVHHELALVEDMVRPSFGYSTHLAAGGWTPSQERVVRERYRLLWGIRTDGALAARGLTGLAGRERRLTEYERAFGFLVEPRRSEVFDALWTGAVATHAELLDLASDPRELAGRRESVPGAACPLCGFAAFRWATAGDLRPAALERVRAEFPTWDSDEPLCARCAEIYNAVAGLEYPATVCL